MSEIETIVYHGTTKRNIEGIVQNGFRESRKDIEWLGKGIYFFTYLGHAEWWASQEAERHGDSPAILKVGLKYRSDALLDLDDPKQFDEFNRFAWDLAERLNKFFTLNLNQDKRKTWCYMCNSYKELHEEIGIISYTFPRNSNLASIFPPNQRQVCVNHENIIQSVDEMKENGV